MLSLTDMWKASGGPSGRGPSDWLALASAKEFVAHVDLIAGNPGNELVHVVRGGKRPRTEAHWQIGLAYAKYLSPAFHMWCNTVVRERMEHKAVAVFEEPVQIDMKAVGGMVKAIPRIEDRFADPRELEEPKRQPTRRL